MTNNHLTTNTIKHTLANLNLLTFEVTDACNLKCKYCGYGEFYEDYDERKNQYLSTDYAKAVIDFLVPYWNSPLNTSVQKRVYVGFYGGEPLLNMPFIESVIDYILNLKLDKQIVFEFSMTTNALLLERYMDFIVKHKFNTLISLDGNRENTAYRVDNGGQPAFDRIIKNVNALRNAYPDYFDKYVNFNSVLHNKNSVESIYTYIKDEYDKIPAISELNNMGIRPEKRDLFERTYKDYQESISSSENYRDIERGMFIKSGTYQTVSTFLQQYSGFVFKDYTDLLLDEKEGKRRPTGTCSPFSKKMFITVNGKILPCERIGQQFALGTVDNNGVHLDFDLLKSILNQLSSTQIQTLHITGANIFKYSKFERLANLLKEYRFNVNIYFHLSNYNIKSVSLLKDFKHNIFIHFPLSPLDNDVLKNIAVDNIIFHFVITSDNDYAQSQQIIEQYNLSNTVFHPFFTGENIIFFEENTFLSENDILESEVKQKTIFANQKLNSNFYGTLHFCSDGNVFSNPNAEPLENIKNIPLLDLIYKEMIENTSWRKIRNEKPCSDCNYQYLCPPVSNYETAIGRPNLCTVF